MFRMGWQMGNKPVFLSKSKVVKGIQCQKALYLQMNCPEVKAEYSEQTEEAFRTGTEVGIYAQQLFPGGVEIAFEGSSFSEQIKRTEEEIKKGTKVIYEATFSHDGVFCKVDILKKVSKGWELYEVKSSTGVKDVYLDDIAIQSRVLKGSGIVVTKSFLVHINNQYVRQGGIEPSKLFTCVDVTGIAIIKEPEIKAVVDNLKAMLAGPLPNIDIGEHCSAPYECEYYAHCTKHIPEVSVFSLRGKGTNKYQLYEQGIITLKELANSGIALNSSVQLQVDSYLNKKEHVDKKAIKEFLAGLTFPLYFLDFETFNCGIPPFDGVRPYQNYPFQYSLHYLTSPKGALKQKHFLAEPNADPRRMLTETLIRDIPSNVCILAFNAKFEKGVMADLAEQFPDLKVALTKRAKNICDLMAPFYAKHYYHWQFMGSYSQKAVLPLFAPHLSYKKLKIQNGGMAMEAYNRINKSKDAMEIDKLRAALLEYCCLDTLGMVEIYRKLLKIVM